MTSEMGNKIFITSNSISGNPFMFECIRLKCFPEFPEMLFQGNKTFITLFTRHVLNLFHQIPIIVHPRMDANTVKAL